jgi:hypothetical protein
MADFTGYALFFLLALAPFSASAVAFRAFSKLSRIVVFVWNQGTGFEVASFFWQRWRRLACADLAFVLAACCVLTGYCFLISAGAPKSGGAGAGAGAAASAASYTSGSRSYAPGDAKSGGGGGYSDSSDGPSAASPSAASPASGGAAAADDDDVEMGDDTWEDGASSFTSHPSTAVHLFRLRCNRIPLLALSLIRVWRVCMCVLLLLQRASSSAPASTSPLCTSACTCTSTWTRRTSFSSTTRSAGG